MKHDEDLLNHDLSKMVNLYKMYGNDGITIVNPAENPGILQVRTRSAEKRHLGKQIGLQTHNQYSRSNFD